MKAALSARAVESAKPSIVRRELSDGDGLYLVVQPNGKKSWAYRYRFDGKPKKLTIGAYPGITLSKARDEALAALKAVQQGKDPAEEKRYQKTTKKEARAADVDTFAGVGRLFLFRYAKPNNRDWREQGRLLGLIPDQTKPDDREDPKTFVAAPGGPAVLLSKKPFRDLRNRDVRAVIEAMVDRGAPIGANRTLQALHRMFEWAGGRDDLGLGENPAAKIEKQPEQKRDRVLSRDEIRLAWLAADHIGWPFGPIVKLLLLTGQRRDEVAGLCQAEINADRTMWILPAARSKNKLEHEVPLAATVKAILESLPKMENDTGLIFTTTGTTPVSGFSRAKLLLDEKMLAILVDERTKRGEDASGVTIPHWTFHDLRRTADTLMHDDLDIAPHIIEAVMNHVSGHKSGVAGRYNKARYRVQKQKALEAWAAHVDRIVTGKQTTITRIGKRA